MPSEAPVTTAQLPLGPNLESWRKRVVSCPRAICEVVARARAHRSAREDEQAEEQADKAEDFDKEVQRTHSGEDLDGGARHGARKSGRGWDRPMENGAWAELASRKVDGFLIDGCAPWDGIDNVGSKMPARTDMTWNMRDPLLLIRRHFRSLASILALPWPPTSASQHVHEGEASIKIIHMNCRCAKDHR